jgi:Ca2+-binding RTX toxin-like protein
VLGGGYVHAHGGAGDDVLSAPRGLRGATLSGGPGDDLLTGSHFDDILAGGAGNDRIVGGAGADHITGGPGLDEIWGGAGRDLIDVKDRAGDIVSCGRGRDRISMDRHDRVSGCEKASRP